MKRLFSINAVRSMVLVLGLSMLFSVAAFASDPTAWYGNGSATQYYIGTAEELAYLSAIVGGANGITDTFVGKTITLTADIDLAGIDSELYKYQMKKLSGYSWIVTPYDGKGWIPIGPNAAWPFRGTFDGTGYVIKNLHINRTDGINQGLFGQLGFAYAGSVKNLGLIDVDVTGNNYVGGMIGRAPGNIENCFVTGKVAGAYGGDYNTGEYVGGIAGMLAGNISNSYSTADITAYSVAGGIGGTFSATIDTVTETSEFLYSTGTITTTWPTTGISSGGINGGIFSAVQYKNNTLKNSVALNEALVSGNTLNMLFHKRIAHKEIGNEPHIDFFNNYAWEGMVFKNLAGQTLLTLPGGTSESEDGESVGAIEIYNGDVWGASYANFPTDKWIIMPGKLPILKIFETRNGSRGGVSVQSGAIPQYILDEVDIELPTLPTVWYNDDTISVENIERLAAVTLWMNIAEVEGAEPLFDGLNGFNVLEVKQDENGNYGVILVYLATGGQGFTSADKTAILKITGAKGVEAFSARVSGYAADGSAYDLTYNLLPNDPTFVPHYDLDGNGVIDQLDLVIALSFYMVDSTDANWNLAKASDFDNNGIVNIKDFVHLLQHMEW